MTLRSFSPVSTLPQVVGFVAFVAFAGVVLAMLPANRYNPFNRKA